MARCCGSTGTCSCKIEAGRNIRVDGMGSSQDPYVIASDIALAVEDTQAFDLGLTGAGTLESPWMLTVRYASTARLNDLPDVNVPSPSQSQVLGWNNNTGMWEAMPPATALAGGMTVDNSLSGDGSVGSPLQVRENAARFLSTTVDGLGLSPDGINLLVRRFSDATARNSASPAPQLGAVSTLSTKPGRLDYWDGTSWQPIVNGVGIDAGAEFLALSGSYTGGETILFTKMLSQATLNDGTFDILSADDLAGRAGVLSVQVQPTGGTPWVPMATADGTRIKGTAYNLAGTLRAGVVVTASVTALLY